MAARPAPEMVALLAAPVNGTGELEEPVVTPVPEATGPLVVEAVPLE